MTNPTLERAARAAYDHPESFAAGCWVDPPEHLDLTSVVVDGHVNLIEIARAVLMAVREPDELMIDAGKKDSPYVDQEDVGDIFTAMIDAILNDGEGE